MNDLDFLNEQNISFRNETINILKDIFPNEPACNIDGAALEITAIFAGYRNDFAKYIAKELKSVMEETNER